jgi:uncharacterized hydrophobic protein (TIGR00341 family)
MSLRMLEVIVPRDVLPELVAEISDDGALGVWSSHVDQDSGLLRILVSAERTEALTDKLSSRFSSDAGFRMLLFMVEATLPAIGDDERSSDERAPHERKGPLRISREELHHDLSEASRISKVYLTTVALSTLVAAVGVLNSSVAVVIGAMVIAPLLGPNVALALASALGDVTLAQRALKTNVAGVATALVLSVVVGLLLPVDPAGAEIASRTSVGIGDIVLALAAGAAGTLAFTQGLSAAVIGVMVAVALLPPLVVAGLLLGSGNVDLAYGAFLLVAVNVACVNLAGVVTFLAQRVQPANWWEADRAAKASRIAVASWIGMLLLLVVLVMM